MQNNETNLLSGKQPASGRVPPLYRRAFDILAGEIARGELAGGTRLQEKQIADRFGISRAPVRQALALLEDHGLVRKHRSRGYEVAQDIPWESRADWAAPQIARPQTHLSSAATWEQIYGEVEAEIIARIAFGAWRIREADLARHHDVSRTVARDVLTRLQERGLVQKDERSHWFAPALTPQHVGELYELRWTLEPLALTKAAAHIPQDVLAAVRTRLSAAIAAPETADGAILDQLEEDLHIGLLSHCRSRALMQAITLPQSLLIAHRFLYRWTPRMFTTEPFLAEHADVLDRLAAGRVAEAAIFMQRHLKQSYDRAVSRVAEVSSRFTPDSLPYLQALPQDDVR